MPVGVHGLVLQQVGVCCEAILPLFSIIWSKSSMLCSLSANTVVLIGDSILFRPELSPIIAINLAI